MNNRLATALRGFVLAGAVLGLGAGAAGAATNDIPPNDTRNCQTPSGNGGGTTYGKCGSICPGGTIGKKDPETNRYNCTPKKALATAARAMTAGPLTR